MRLGTGWGGWHCQHHPSVLGEPARGWGKGGGEPHLPPVACFKGWVGKPLRDQVVAAVGYGYSEPLSTPLWLFLRASPWQEGAGDTHSTDRACRAGPWHARPARGCCSQPGLLDSCQRAEWAVQPEGPPSGGADDSVCGGASWGLGPWAGSCRNSGSTRSSLRRRPLWSWAPLLWTRFSSSTRPGGGHRIRGPSCRELPTVFHRSSLPVLWPQPS